MELAAVGEKKPFGEGEGNMKEALTKTESIDRELDHDKAVHVQMTPGRNVYFSIPWSPQIYFTVRGAENFHIYLWIAKDLAWSQNSLYPAMIFGVSAMAWCGVLVFHAIDQRCFNEMYMLVPLILWLAGNFVWMTGEVVHGDDDVEAPNAAIIMETAISLILLYYFVLKPFKLLPPDKMLNDKYEEAELKPRFSFLFSNWREYEHAHTLCWLGKDLSWNRENPYFWCICLVPTVLIGLDFIWVTFKTGRMTIDCAHYMAQFIWVIGNFVWAMSEIFDIPGNDDDQPPYSMWHSTSEARRHLRWWSSIVLIVAYVPIFALYCFWLPLTCMGRIKAADIPQNVGVRGTSFSEAPTSSGGAAAATGTGTGSGSTAEVKPVATTTAADSGAHSHGSKPEDGEVYNTALHGQPSTPSSPPSSSSAAASPPPSV